jgi:YjjG family noncanonical pyrimidine nucleotidase
MTNGLNRTQSVSPFDTLKANGYECWRMDAHNVPRELSGMPELPGARRYGWLLFDADGTLFDYDRAETTALSEAFGQIGVTFAPAWLADYRRINKAVWQALEQGQITPDALKVRRFELLLQTIGVAHPAADLSELYLQCLASRSDLIDGACELLQALQGRYRSVILTNGLRAVQRNRLARSRIRDYIAELIISEEIGHAKPAREFFDAAFARLGHPPKHEALMIGDNWSSDIEGAAKYGIDTCWYNPARLPRPGSPLINYEITSLRELLGLLR